MFNFVEGEVVLIDKELHWSSFDIVNYLKPAIHEFTQKHCNQNTKIKIGHAGTLDPLATGLLIICTGKKTKTIQEIQNLPKTYTGAFFIGATTPSFDKELPIDATYSVEHIDESFILKTAQSFIGQQLQYPPAFSAVNVGGKRAYQLARENQAVEIAPRPITIYRFDITKIELPLVYFEIECSKGTYIRAIARDFGKALNSGAYLDNLRRTKIGDYSIDDALTVKQFVHLIKNL